MTIEDTLDILIRQEGVLESARRLPDSCCQREKGRCCRWGKDCHISDSLVVSAYCADMYIAKSNVAVHILARS